MEIIKGLKFPNRITVELTNACNIDCTFCPRQHVSMHSSFMNFDTYKKIVDEMAQHIPICLVLFLRGESLLHPEIIQCIKYAKEKNINPVQLASNGLLLEGKMQDDIIASGLDFISFSLDTNDKEIYEKSRKYSDFDRSHHNILSFLQKCNEYKTRGYKVPETQVSTINLDVYQNGQQEFIEFWERYADTVRVYEEHSSDGNLGSIKGLKQKNEKRLPCQKIYTDMVIYCDGVVALCNHDWDTKSAIGNVNDHSVSELWNGQRYQDIRAMHEEGNIESDLNCKNCDHWRMYYTPEGFLGKTYKRKSAGTE